ncbi:hypothetical protein GGE50_005074 [Rhizobium leguminosarum]|nr:putative acetyltransferase protein [Rhizobium leguminosarum bv. viciae]MBB4331460.1 hypothetical protein [Rhizobium leguminosarum]MDH6663024.1 hypothetical protein [Rhizobium sophorae]MBB4344811.1 hypothetical protein [Rhizobium leguminosarum]MBB4356768.1 hypothetical protein [Rhizobium leguminosarum]
MDNDLRFEPVTPERWDDFEIVFGPQGAFYNCWCVALRLPHAIRTEMAADERKAHMRGRIKAGPPPGILCYAEGAPVAWVQVGPRHDVPRSSIRRAPSRGRWKRAMRRIHLSGPSVASSCCPNCAARE